MDFPNGLLAVVKRECPTCTLVAPAPDARRVVRAADGAFAAVLEALTAPRRH